MVYHQWLYQGFGSSCGRHVLIVGIVFGSMNRGWGKGWLCDGHPFESVLIGILDVMGEEIRLPNQISGPPVGWRSALRSVAIFLAMTDVHIGVWPFLRHPISA